jgi:hypothetical protein
MKKLEGASHSPDQPKQRLNARNWVGVGKALIKRRNRRRRITFRQSTYDYRSEDRTGPGLRMDGDHRRVPSESAALRNVNDPADRALIILLVKFQRFPNVALGFADTLRDLLHGQISLSPARSAANTSLAMSPNFPFFSHLRFLNFLSSSR